MDVYMAKRQSDQQGILVQISVRRPCPQRSLGEAMQNLAECHNHVDTLAFTLHRGVDSLYADGGKELAC